MVVFLQQLHYTQVDKDLIKKLAHPEEAANLTGNEMLVDRCKTCTFFIRKCFNLRVTISRRAYLQTPALVRLDHWCYSARRGVDRTLSLSTVHCEDVALNVKGC